MNIVTKEQYLEAKMAMFIYTYDAFLKSANYAKNGVQSNRQIFEDYKDFCSVNSLYASGRKAFYGYLKSSRGF